MFAVEKWTAVANIWIESNHLWILHHSSLSLDLMSKTNSSVFDKNSTLSAKQKCVGKKHFHITQHLCPNCCPNNADQLSPQLPQIQPIDAALLAAVKSKSDAYHSVVSTSPVLYLTHPSSQPPRRPLTLNLPCPPNPEKKRRTRGQGEPPDHQTRPISASPAWDQPASHRRWV